jgi:putative transcriptional regulator
MGKFKKYPSQATASIHEAVSDLYKVGGIDEKTMRKFDALCISPIQVRTPQHFRARRKRKKSNETA